MNHAISINPDKTLVITVPEGTEVDRVKIRKMGTQESKLYWRDEVLDQYKWERDIAIQQLKELGYGFGQEPKTDGDTISRQAAIDAVSEACFELRGVFGRCEDALKALPPAEPELAKYSPKLDNENGELISRQAAIDLVGQHIFYDDYENTDELSLISGLRALPSVQPERKKGKWIDDGDCLICSCCKKAYTFSGSNFCPNCGADMRGGREE